MGVRRVEERCADVVETKATVTLASIPQAKNIDTSTGAAPERVRHMVVELAVARVRRGPG